MNITDRTTYRLPKAFITDSISCDVFPEDVVVRENRQFVWASLTLLEVGNLVSRARYYLSITDEPSLNGLRSSARATLKAIVAHGTDPNAAERLLGAWCRGEVQ